MEGDGGDGEERGEGQLHQRAEAASMVEEEPDAMKERSGDESKKKMEDILVYNF